MGSRIDVNSLKSIRFLTENPKIFLSTHRSSVTFHIKPLNFWRIPLCPLLLNLQLLQNDVNILDNLDLIPFTSKRSFQLLPSQPYHILRIHVGRSSFCKAGLVGTFMGAWCFMSILFFQTSWPRIFFFDMPCKYFSNIKLQ